MNTRYLLTQESICNSGTGVMLPNERVLVNSRVRPYSSRTSSSSPPPFVVRIAMRVARSRWFSFLRRVYHYQNGSRSDLGSNPFNTGRWMLMELVALAVQIFVVLYTLFVSKAEKPVWPMRIWVAGYSFGCFLSLLLLYWRYRVFYRAGGDSNPDSELQRNHEESSNLQYMNKCRTSLELLFAIWFVMGNVWVFDSRFGSFRLAPKLHILCITVLAWNAISYSFPFILFLLLCCCVPLVNNLLGYNMNMASLDRGATDEQLSKLPSWTYKQVHVEDLELGNSTKEYHDEECCICLAKYKDKEEIRQLPCTHTFHLNCVDQWLKITSCCPLCKQRLEK